MIIFTKKSDLIHAKNFTHKVEIMNWHTATLEDVEIMQKESFNNKLSANNYSSVNSFIYQKKYNSFVSITDNWVYEKYVDYECKHYDGKCVCYGFPHNIDGDSSGLPAALKTLFEDIKKNGGTYCCFKNLTIEEKQQLDALYESFSLEMRDLGDYIYLTENLAGLPGKTYSKKRNHVNQFKKKYADYNLQPLTAENASVAMEIEEKWLGERSEEAQSDGSIADLKAEREIIKTALDNFDYFSKTCGMTGGILYIQGQPAAFCLASQISSDVTDVHFEKCIGDYARDGGYAIINNEFSKTVKTMYLNREEDLGIEGLRKAKLSYYPEKVLEKFNARVDLTKLG